MKRPAITYFFRKPVASFYSIERLFDTIIKHLSRSKVERVSLLFSIGESPLAMLRNCLFARSRQGQINHITGEVYYIALALKRQNTILTIHDLESLGSNIKLKHFLLQQLWLHLPVRRARYVTVVSAYSKSRLIAATGIAEEKVVVIPNCVDIAGAEFKPRPYLNKQEPVLLQVGTKTNKNLETLIQATAGLSCRLIILGKLSPAQKALLNCHSIRYEQYHDLPYEEVKQLYYRADILTFVSEFEGFGLPILEANALGRPVITSNTTAMPEVAGEAALLVDPGRSDKLRVAIELLVADDVLRNTLVEKGFLNVQRFKPAAIAAQYEALYDRVLNL